jgi:hypothetical protein
MAAQAVRATQLSPQRRTACAGMVATSCVMLRWGNGRVKCKNWTTPLTVYELVKTRRMSEWNCLR